MCALRGRTVSVGIGTGAAEETRNPRNSVERVRIVRNGENLRSLQASRCRGENRNSRTTGNSAHGHATNALGHTVHCLGHSFKSGITLYRNPSMPTKGGNQQKLHYTRL